MRDAGSAGGGAGDNHILRGAPGGGAVVIGEGQRAGYRGHRPVVAGRGDGHIARRLGVQHHGVRGSHARCHAHAVGAYGDAGGIVVADGDIGGAAGGQHGVDQRHGRRGRVARGLDGNYEALLLLTVAVVFDGDLESHLRAIGGALRKLHAAQGARKPEIALGAHGTKIADAGGVVGVGGADAPVQHGHLGQGRAVVGDHATQHAGALGHGGRATQGEGVRIVGGDGGGIDRAPESPIAAAGVGVGAGDANAADGNAERLGPLGDAVVIDGDGEGLQRAAGLAGGKGDGIVAAGGAAEVGVGGVADGGNRRLRALVADGVAGGDAVAERPVQGHAARGDVLPGAAVIAHLVGERAGALHHFVGGDGGADIGGGDEEQPAAAAHVHLPLYAGAQGHGAAVAGHLGEGDGEGRRLGGRGDRRQRQARADVEALRLQVTDAHLGAGEAELAGARVGGERRAAAAGRGAVENGAADAVANAHRAGDGVVAGGERVRVEVGVVAVRQVETEREADEVVGLGAGGVADLVRADGVAVVDRRDAAGGIHLAGAAAAAGAGAVGVADADRQAGVVLAAGGDGEVHVGGGAGIDAAVAAGVDIYGEVLGGLHRAVVVQEEGEVDGPGAGGLGGQGGAHARRAARQGGVDLGAGATALGRVVAGHAGAVYALQKVAGRDIAVGAVRILRHRPTDEGAFLRPAAGDAEAEAQRVVVAGGRGFPPTAVGFVAVGVGAANGFRGEGGGVAGVNGEAVAGHLADCFGAVGEHLKVEGLGRLGEIVVRNGERDRERIGSLVAGPTAHHQGLLGDDVAGGVGGDGADAHAAGSAVMGDMGRGHRHPGDINIADGGRVADAAAAVAVAGAAHEAPGDAQRVGGVQGAGRRVAAETHVVSARVAFAGTAGAGVAGMQPGRAAVLGAGAAGSELGKPGEVIIRQHGVAGAQGVVVHGEQSRGVSGTYKRVVRHLQHDRGRALGQNHPAVALRRAADAALRSGQKVAGAGEAAAAVVAGAEAIGGGAAAGQVEESGVGVRGGIAVGQNRPQAEAVAGLGSRIKSVPQAVGVVGAGLGIAGGGVVIGEGEGKADAAAVLAADGAAGLPGADRHRAGRAGGARLGAEDGVVQRAVVGAGGQGDRAAAAAGYGGRADQAQVQGLVQFRRIVIHQGHDDDQAGLAGP